MVEHGIHIGRKNGLVIFIHTDRWVGPPKKSLRERRPIEKLPLYLDICFAWIKRETRHALRSRHSFHFIYPNGFATIFVLFNKMIHFFKCGWPVVLWPVELDSSRDPGTGETDQRR